MGRPKSATQSTQQVHIYFLTMMMKTLLLLPLLLMVVNCQNTKHLDCPGGIGYGHRNINCVRTHCTITCPKTGDQVFLNCESNKVEHIHNVGNTKTVVRCRSVKSG